MKQVVMIDTDTEIGKNISALLHTLSTNSKAISFLSEEELEDLEDKVLGTMMYESMKSGKADKQDLLKLLGRA